MTVHYKVTENGRTVYEHKTKTYDKDGIPVEWRGRPAKGTRRLYVNDELIAVQTAEEGN
jgi:hypothetical protein